MYYKPIVEHPIYKEKRSWHADGRGKLIEILRNDDYLYDEDFGQSYITTVSPGITKAWHFHAKQTDRMMLVHGTIRFGGVRVDVSENMQDSKEQVLLDLVVSALDPCIIKIPPNIYHGFKNLGNEEAFIINIPDLPYDHKDPDEDRAPPDAFKHIFDWNACLDG